MRIRVVGAVFLAICVILAVLLLARLATYLVSGLIFAVVLVVSAALATHWVRRSAHRRR